MVRLLFLFLFTFYLAPNVYATTYSFNYTPGCAQAYKAYLALRPDEGDAIIKREILANPYNLLSLYIADYGDFLTLLFNGDSYERSQRASHENERIRLISQGRDDEPWKRLSLAGIHLHWAIIHIRFGEQFKAAVSFRKSYILLRENTALFPKFAPNHVLYGAEEAVAGTIPDQYAWLMTIFGMKGSLAAGMSNLSSFLKENNRESPLYEEALIYDLYIRFYLGADKAAVWKIAGNDAIFDVHNNLLHAFVRANLALSYRKADAAFGALMTAQAIPGARNYPVFDYEMGCTQLLRLDPSCTEYLERYASRNKGTLFTKDALQKSALAWYLQGNKAKATSVRSSILSFGTTNTDADRQAQRFAKTESWPNQLLLTARMLIDGGYYSRALQKLQSTTSVAFPAIADQVEYNFRLGRALEETNDVARAVQVYQSAINQGKDRTEYFAARAALQMAGIYEQRSQMAEARRYYELCLSMHDHDFQSSIDQQAKAGLQRVNGD